LNKGLKRKGELIMAWRFLRVTFFLALTLFCMEVRGAPPSWAEGQYLTLPSEIHAHQENLQRQKERTVVAQKRQQKEAEHQVRKEAIAEFFQEKNKHLGAERAESYAHYVLEAAHTFGVDPFLIAAIIIKESRVRDSAKSRVAYGLMQINWKVHRHNIGKAFSHIRTLTEMMKPKNNILVGTYIFSCYLSSSNGDLGRALLKYYGGKNVKYVNKIYSYRHELDKRFAKKLNSFY
jgi:soluble lytic murein transglycosylase-like protein